jgi:hypothetical protein
MQKLNASEFNDLVRDGQVLISNSSEDIMVFLTSGGDIVKKLLYKDKYLSRFFPRAVRFRKNCKRLTSLGFKTMSVKALFDFPEGSCHVLIYPMIAGEALSKYLDGEAEESLKKETLMRAAAYYGQLHEKGVYCRPTHFRNIIICPDSVFALIDVQNIRFRRLALDLWTRSRNFKYILKYKENLNQVIAFGAKEFFDCYMAQCQMSTPKQRIFLALLRRNVPDLFHQGKNADFRSGPN